MGSKGSKPRKPEHHLAKVGSRANDEWEQHERRRLAFGTGAVAVVLAVILIAAMIGWLALT